MNRVLQAVLIALLWAVVAEAAVEVPYLSGRVNDEAEILSREMRRSLSDRLKEHEERTSDQVVVLTVRTLGGESIEEFATRVFDSWKLGQRGKDNGVLVIVAPDDRRMRIEVGYGLEHRLTDLLAGRIIRNVMTPRFKAGDYNGGIDAGVQAVLAVLQNGDTAGLGGDAETEAPARPGSGLDMPDMPFPMRILIGVFIFGIIGLFTFMGIMTPGVGWFLYFFLIPFWAVFPMVVVGMNVAIVLLVLYVVGFPVTKIIISRKEWYKKMKEDLKKKGRASIGGFTISSGSGGGGGWSSGGGGGFSGGGGSSGGGGASGSW